MSIVFFASKVPKAKGETAIKRRSRVVLVLALCLASGCCTSGDTPAEEQLLDVKWTLQEISYSTQSIVSSSETYWVRFRPGGSFEMQVDCNFCQGSFTLENNSFIHVDTPYTCTDAYCGDTLKSDEFHAAMGRVSRYEVSGGSLRLYFGSSQGYLAFVATSGPS